MFHLNMDLNTFSVGLAIFIRLWVTTASSNTMVETPNGPIEGSRVQAPNGKSVEVFFGIPYATPPLNELRFKPPLASKPWKTKLNATSRAKSCVQFPSGLTEKYPKFEMLFLPENESTSEDCLYLNIWTPSKNKAKSELAVMVYIYGGAFQTGSSSLDLYDGSVLASEGNVIVVNFNYRHSLFGLLYLDIENSPGNMALMDQVLAFKWVRMNIASFGGDPNKVTIFGQSAGGASVSQHLLLPASRNLFARAIIQSGTTLSSRFFDSKDESLAKSKRVASLVGCGFSFAEDIVNCLTGKTTKELVDAAVANKIQFIPTIDGKYFPYSPVEMVRNGFLNASIEIMTGHCTADGFKPSTLSLGLIQEDPNLFITEKEFENHLKSSLGQAAKLEKLIKKVKRFYSRESKASDTNWRRNLVEYLTDTQVVCSTNTLADMASENGNTVYKYQFSYITSMSPLPVWQQVAHGFELQFVFGKPLIPINNYPQNDETFSRRIINMWTNFAKFGFPKEGGLISIPISTSGLNWANYTSSKKQNYVLNKISYVKKAISSQRCNLLLSVPTFDDRK